MVHWNGLSTMGYGEFIVQSAQHHGMSGSASSNGCGYLGMSHLAVCENLANFAAIIGAEVIIKFVERNKNKLPYWTACPEIKIVQLPIMPFMNCAVPKDNDEECAATGGGEVDKAHT